jgi:hypothetical protein
MPLHERTSRHLDAVERLHLLVLEVQPDRVIRQDLRVHVATAQAAPREDGSAGGDREGPEVGRGDEVFAERWRVGLHLAVLEAGEDSVGPEGDEGDPAGVAVHGLEVVVVGATEVWVGTAEDEAEHGEQDVRRDHVSGRRGRLGVREVPGGNHGVEDVPEDGGDTGTTMGTSIMERLGEAFAQPQGRGVRAGTKNFVDEVDEVLLTEEDGDHEVGRGRTADLRGFWKTLVPDREDDQGGDIGKEDN